MKGHGIHIAQSAISGKVMRSAADVGIVRYTIITSDRSSIAKDSHVLSTSGMDSSHSFSG